MHTVLCLIKVPDRIRCLLLDLIPSRLDSICTRTIEATRSRRAPMDKKSLLSVLSPQLQALVEASLGTPLQANALAQSSAPPVKPESNGKVDKAADEAIEAAVADQRTGGSGDALAASASYPAVATNVSRPSKAASANAKLNPSELFVLKHPESPGFVVKDAFLGSDHAVAVRDALLALTKTELFHEAKVGHGDHLRNERTVRGDRIHWVKRPSDLNRSDVLHPAILYLMKQVESVAYGFKKANPDLDLRNVTSTQFAIFPGDGSRFVKHTDTYSTAHQDESGISSSSDGLVRILTCVYYLNQDWVPEHEGQLRVYVKGTSTLPMQHWDVAPKLDTLVVFRSLDVEHEVLPTFHERMAITVWYYGRAAKEQPDPASRSGLLKQQSQTSSKPLPSLSQNSNLSSKEAGDARTIFVGIPSYRDPECRHTVADLLQKATFPDRIHIGIYLQENENDDTLRHFEETYPRSQVRMQFVDYRSAAGPCVARAGVQKLWNGEDFYLQIDSHMRFRAGWDVFLLDQLQLCASSKPILTTYPLGYALPNNVSSDRRPTLLCASAFDENGILRQASKTLAAISPVPLPSSFWAAGFAFSSSKVISEVPYDDSLRFLFFGEEVSMSARLWTSGWDFFTPGESIIYHLWTRSYRRVFQEIEVSETTAWRTASQRYVKSLLLGGDNNQEPTGSRSAGTYSLGSERSLEAYQQRIGVNFAKQEIQWGAGWGNLDPIQFELNTKSAGVHAPA
ncbi:C transferase, partial [Globisporangium splendens]